MPRKPSFLKRVGRVVKKRYFKGKGYARPKVGRMIKDIRYIKSLMNVEKKSIDTDVASQTFGANDGWLQVLTNPPHGDGYNNRNGSSIKLYSYQISGRITQQSSVQNAIKGRVILFAYDQTPDTPLVSDFLETDGAGNYSSLSFRNPNKMGDFKIIASRNIYVKERQVSTLETDTTFTMFGKFRGMHQRYTGAAASTITTNQLYLLFIMDDGTTAASTGAYIKGLKARINYIDN